MKDFRLKCDTCGFITVFPALDNQAKDTFDIEYMCNNCGKIKRFRVYAKPNVKDIDDSLIDSMMYEPIEIDNDSKEYDMQPRKR